jgi:hypothetical protein
VRFSNENTTTALYRAGGCPAFPHTGRVAATAVAAVVGAVVEVIADEPGAVVAVVVLDDAEGFDELHAVSATTTTTIVPSRALMTRNSATCR